MKKLVLIEWVDSSSHNTGWTNKKDFDLTHITSVGFLVKETEEYYAITHTFGSKNAIFNPFVIPKGCVKEVFEIDASEEQSERNSTRVFDSEACGTIRIKG